MRTFTLYERTASALNLLPNAVYDTFPAVLFGRILLIAVRLGIIDALSERPLTPQQLSTILPLHPKSAELLLPLLQSSGYVKGSTKGYSLTSQSRKWLVRSSPQYIGNFLAYIELLHHRWDTLEETLKAGKPPSVYTETFTPAHWRVYTMGMMDLAKLTLPHLLSKIVLPKESKNLLDLCGSHGLYAIELCKKYPSLSATIADLPEVLTITKEILITHRFEDRVTLLPIDATKSPLPENTYDVVLAFNILHGFDEETNRQFFRTIASALAAGGRAYILDQLKRPGMRGVGSVLPLVVGINLMNEVGGYAYSLKDVRSWCEQAGLSEVRHNRLRLPGMDLVSAKKR